MGRAPGRRRGGATIAYALAGISHAVTSCSAHVVVLEKMCRPRKRRDVCSEYDETWYRNEQRAACRRRRFRYHSSAVVASPPCRPKFAESHARGSRARAGAR